MWNQYIKPNSVHTVVNLVKQHKQHAWIAQNEYDTFKYTEKCTQRTVHWHQTLESMEVTHFQHLMQQNRYSDKSITGKSVNKPLHTKKWHCKLSKCPLNPQLSGKSNKTRPK